MRGATSSLWALVPSRKGSHRVGAGWEEAAVRNRLAPQAHSTMAGLLWGMLDCQERRRQGDCWGLTSVRWLLGDSFPRAPMLGQVWALSLDWRKAAAQLQPHGKAVKSGLGCSCQQIS